MKKNNYFEKEGPQNNTFKQSKSIEIITNPKTLYEDNVKITTNSEKEYKKLFYLSKRNKRIYFTVIDFYQNIKNKNNNYNGKENEEKEKNII